MLQWIAALERVAKESHFTGKNRFDSFAPIRLNVAAQWLVDGVTIHLFLTISGILKSWIKRDYFWNLSRAILLAKESIYIHDWWLSPGTFDLYPILLQHVLTQNEHACFRAEIAAAWHGQISPRLSS